MVGRWLILWLAGVPEPAVGRSAPAIRARQRRPCRTDSTCGEIAPKSCKKWEHL
jgi:hypothetical protein